MSLKNNHHNWRCLETFLEDGIGFNGMFFGKGFVLFSDQINMLIVVTPAARGLLVAPEITREQFLNNDWIVVGAM